MQVLIGIAGCVYGVWCLWGDAALLKALGTSLELGRHQGQVVAPELGYSPEGTTHGCEGQGWTMAPLK